MSKDIRPPWLNLARRLQSMGRMNDGYALVSIDILIDASGNPKLWFDPEITKIEPKSVGLGLLESELSTEQLNDIASITALAFKSSKNKV